MKKKDIQVLKDHLKADKDYFNLFIESVNHMVSKTPAFIHDYFYKALNINDKKQAEKAYHDFIESFILFFLSPDETTEKTLMDNFIIKEPNMGISWIRVNDVYLDGDMLWQDFKRYLNG